MSATGFTVLIALVWISLFITIAVFFRRLGLFYRFFSVDVLFFIIFLCFLRLFVPIEFFAFTGVVNSRKYLRSVFHIIGQTVFTFNLGGYTVDMTWGMLLLSISSAGSFVVLCRKIKEAYDVKKLLSLSLPCEDARINDMVKTLSARLGIRRNIKVTINSGFISPAVAGWVCPVIVMPCTDFNETELKGILVHELAHYKYKHLIIKLLANLIEILLWWNPFIHRLRKEVDNALEFHADSKLSYLLDYDEQYKYLCAIVKVVKNAENKTLPNLAIGLSAAKEDVLEQRFRLILEKCYNKRHRLNNVLLCIMLCALFIYSYSFVVQPYVTPTYEDYNDGAPFIAPDSYILCGKDLYAIYDPKGEMLSVREMPIADNLKSLEIRDARGNMNEN